MDKHQGSHPIRGNRGNTQGVSEGNRTLGTESSIITYPYLTLHIHGMLRRSLVYQQPPLPRNRLMIEGVEGANSSASKLVLVLCGTREYTISSARQRIGRF